RVAAFVSGVCRRRASCYSVFSTSSATPANSTLSLHDALPISSARPPAAPGRTEAASVADRAVDELAEQVGVAVVAGVLLDHVDRSEEHTSELQSRENLVCRLLLEKKKKEEFVYCT